MKEIEGKVGIITGAGSGMGKSTACLLAQKGAKLLLASRRKEPLKKTAGEINRAGGTACWLSTDVSIPEQVEKMAEFALAAYGGRIDFLVNAAGIGVWGGMSDFSAQNVDAIIDINLKGTIYCCQAVLPAMIKRQSGYIINIASMAAKGGIPGRAVYSASKAGAVNFSQGLLGEVRSHNIKVSAILPGSTNSNFGCLPGDTPRHAPWKLSPEDIAGTILHLLSSSDNYCQSQVEMRPLKTG